MSRTASSVVLALVVSGCSAESRYEHLLGKVTGPGAQMAVIEPDGSTWSGSTGVARGDTPVTGETAFLVGSTTKVFTAAVVLQLVEEGRIGLDDPASEWVPDIRDDITVRHLLMHTSGMGEYFDNEVLVPGAPARGLEWTPEDLVVLGREVRDDGPQSEGAYANTNFIVLGRVVEAVEGRPYEVVVQERIFDTLGMEGSGILLHGAPVDEDLAWGDAGEMGAVTTDDPSVGWAAGSAYAPTPDTARFFEAVFGAELYGDDLVAEQVDGNPADLGFGGDGMVTEYGLGMMVITIDGRTIFGHTGGVPGFFTLSVHDPESGAIVVVSSNGDDAEVVGPTLGALRVASKQ